MAPKLTTSGIVRQDPPAEACSRNSSSRPPGAILLNAPPNAGHSTSLRSNPLAPEGSTEPLLF